MKARFAFIVCLLLVLFPIVTYGEVWDLAEDYSIAENPNGVWSYGWRTVPEEPLILYTEKAGRCGAPHELEYWNHPIEDDCPRVTRNPQDYPVLCDYTVFAPHKVNFHPGPHQQSVVRWTAPADMEVMLTVNFKVIDVGSSIVHIYYNATSLFWTSLDQFGETADYSSTISVQAGDVIDCAVDPTSFYADSIELDVVLDEGEPTPVQPTTWGRIKTGYR